MHQQLFVLNCIIFLVNFLDPISGLGTTVCEDCINPQGCGLMPCIKGHQTGASKRVVNGRTAEPHELPYIARILYNYKNGAVMTCGGSILNRRFILTAAHCVDSDDFDGGSFSVITGDHSEMKTEAFEAKYQIDKAFVHSSYSQHKHGGRLKDVVDVAIVRLTNPIAMNKGTIPICLTSAAPPSGQQVLTSGWGRMGIHKGSEDYPSALRHAGLVIVAKCAKPQAKYANKYLCTSWRQGRMKDSCAGDSGGPLVNFQTLQGASATANCKANQVGIVSHGPECDAQKTKKSTGEYVSVPETLDWIQKVMAGKAGSSAIVLNIAGGGRANAKGKKLPGHNQAAAGQNTEQKQLVKTTPAPKMEAVKAPQQTGKAIHIQIPASSTNNQIQASPTITSTKVDIDPADVVRQMKQGIAVKPTLREASAMRRRFISIAKQPHKEDAENGGKQKQEVGSMEKKGGMVLNPTPKVQIQIKLNGVGGDEPDGVDHEKQNTHHKIDKTAATITQKSRKKADQKVNLHRLLKIKNDKKPSTTVAPSKAGINKSVQYHKKTKTGFTKHGKTATSATNTSSHHSTVKVKSSNKDKSAGKVGGKTNPRKSGDKSRVGYKMKKPTAKHVHKVGVKKGGKDAAAATNSTSDDAAAKKRELTEVPAAKRQRNRRKPGFRTKLGNPFLRRNRKNLNRGRNIKTVQKPRRKSGKKLDGVGYKSKSSQKNSGKSLHSILKAKEGENARTKSGRNRKTAKKHDGRVAGNVQQKGGLISAKKDSNSNKAVIAALAATTAQKTAANTNRVTVQRTTKKPDGIVVGDLQNSGPKKTKPRNDLLRGKGGVNSGSRMVKGQVGDANSLHAVLAGKSSAMKKSNKIPNNIASNSNKQISGGGANNVGQAQAEETTTKTSLINRKPESAPRKATNTKPKDGNSLHSILAQKEAQAG